METAACEAVPVAAPDKTQGAELVGRGISSWALLFTPVVMNKQEEHCGTTTEKCFIMHRSQERLAVSPGMRAST